MVAVFGDPGHARARIDDDVARAEERAATLPRLQEAMRAVRATAASRQRDIAVEVDGEGVLVSIDIRNPALSRGAERVAQELLKLVADATLDARRQKVAISSEMLGEDDPIVALVRSELDADAEQARAGSVGVRW